MPGRLVPLITGQIYHIFNQGINRKPTFTDKIEYVRAVKTLKHYQLVNPPFKLSAFLKKNTDEQKRLIKMNNNFNAQILAYCFMPNHYHLLLKQTIDNGISKYMSNFQNSYTRYFNTKHDRKGGLFLNQFKNVRIETDDQLIHVSRYIHLNPFTSYLIKSIKDLKYYPYSSFSEYLGNTSNTLCQKELVLNQFEDKDEYKKFVFNHADYQRELDQIKHLVFDD